MVSALEPSPQPRLKPVHEALSPLSQTIGDDRMQLGMTGRLGFDGLSSGASGCSPNPLKGTYLTILGC